MYCYFIILTKYHDTHTVEDKIGEECSMYEKDEKFIHLNRKICREKTTWELHVRMEGTFKTDLKEIR